MGMKKSTMYQTSHDQNSYLSLFLDLKLSIVHIEADVRLLFNN